MPPMPDAFLTYGWCRVSYVILQSLTRRGVRVHIGDASSLAMCRYSRQRVSFSHYRSPYADPEGFVRDIAAAMEHKRATVLIPGHEDVLPIARFRHLLPQHVLVSAPEADSIELANNKWRIVEWARKHGVPAPATLKPGSRVELVEHAHRLAYPAVVKTQIGNSAKGVFFVNNPQECIDRFEDTVRTYNLALPKWPVLQEYISDHGYGVCLLYNRGQFRGAFCERYLRCKDGQHGTSVYRESVLEPTLIRHARALMDPLNWHGVAHVDFLYDPATQRTALIEVNPRFWGALDLAVRSGADFPWLLYRMTVDGDVEPLTEYRLGVRSRWILGEVLHLINLAKRGRLGQLTRTLSAICRSRADGFDDFRARDPLPLLGEFLYYGTRFLATGSTNPVEEGMIG